MLIARNSESISSDGEIIFKSPPSRKPDFSTTEAIDMSSAVSPEAGTITSPPLLKTAPLFISANVSTSRMTVS